MYFWVFSHFLGSSCDFWVLVMGLFRVSLRVLGPPHRYFEISSCFFGRVLLVIFGISYFLEASLWFLGSSHGLSGSSHIFLVSSHTFQLPIFHPLPQPTSESPWSYQDRIPSHPSNCGSGPNFWLGKKSASALSLPCLQPAPAREPRPGCRRLGSTPPATRILAIFGIYFPLKVEFWDFEV